MNMPTLEIKKSDNLLSNDYYMLESDSAVKKSISQINMLIEKTKINSFDSLYNVRSFGKS